MYTLENLQNKNLKELKEIGWELNVVPEGDRRCRQNWINALVGAVPPLLQLLESSPDVEPVEDAIEIQRQEPIESKFGRIVYPKPAVKSIAQTEKTTPEGADGNTTARAATPLHLCVDSHNKCLDTAELHGNSSGIESSNPQHKESDRVLEVAGNGQRDKGRALLNQPTELAAIYNGDKPPNRGDGKGRIEPELSQSAIAPAAKTSTAHQLLELFKSKAQIMDDSPGFTSEPKVSQSAIDLATENLPRSESDLNPILTGIPLSDSFLARYSPPQAESIHFQSDADGQLSLLDFEVESVDEPPDPDDFPSIDAFNNAIALWDAQHPAEPIEISLDSMCEWAPCPDAWYEPAVAEVPEHPPTAESSSTCNFSIPTFDAWCDRQNDNDEPPNPEDFDSMFAFWAAYDKWLGEDDDTDEPPDTGICARLPGPKPPKFPPTSVIAGDRANRIKKFARSAALVSGRSPPGGDAMH